MDERRELTRVDEVFPLTRLKSATKENAKRGLQKTKIPFRWIWKGTFYFTNGLGFAIYTWKILLAFSVVTRAMCCGVVA